MNRFVSTGALFLTIVVLLFLMIGLQSFEFGADASVFNPKSLAATGFIVLAAFTMGEFFRQLGIPALLGYIAAGILFGPNLAPMLPGAPEALFGKQVISDLSLINVLTVGVIGTMGGGELRMQDIRGNVKTIFLVIGLIFVLVVPATTGAVLLLADFFPSLVPFLEGTTPESKIAAALLLGVFALAMSPAATLAILQETRAKGKFTSLVLGIVVVADIFLVLFFLLTFALDKLLLEPAGFDASALMSALPTIGAEFGYALVIGVVTGIIFILYLQFVAREKLLFTVALIFGASYVSQLLHAETLMAFLTAGFIVTNFSRHGHDMIHSLEKISLPVFVIYFMTQAALLDLKAVAGFIGVTAILSLIRGLAFYAGAKLGTQWSGASDNAKRYLWLCFFSRGGVDLVLAAMVASQIGPWGTDFQTVIMACVVVHIVAGPPLLKLGLDWAGETEGSRDANRSEAEALGDFGELEEDLESLEDSFPEPNVGDEDLAARLYELRDFLIDLHERYVVRSFESNADRLRSSLKVLSTAVDKGFAELRDILDSDEYGTDEDGRADRADAVRNSHVAFRKSIASIVEDFEALDPVPMTPAKIDELLGDIRGKERFANTYRVLRGDHLFNSDEDDSSFARLLKVGRRIRRSVLGPGHRSIPLGRLWRFYVELSVPRYLARAASASASHNEEFWSQLGVHIRRTDDVFIDARAAILGEEVQLDPHRALTEVQATHGDEGTDTDESEAPRQSPEEIASELLAARTEALKGRRRHNAETLKSWISASLEFYTLSLSETFGSFLRSASRAGTLELPAFRYRPSARFDASRRAENQLRERLERERAVVDGHRGWIILDHQLLSFLYWFEDYEIRVGDALDAVLGHPVRRQLGMLEERCLILPEVLRGTNDGDTISPELSPSGELLTENAAIIDWNDWLNRRLRPTLRRSQRTFEHTLFAFGQGTAARRLLDVLESRISRFSNELTLLGENPDIAGADTTVTARISTREWFSSELARETALRFVELNERVESLVRVAIDSLEEIEQVVEFNLLTAYAEAQAGDQIQANSTAMGGLKRAARMVDELSDDQARHVQELKRWVLSEIDGILGRSTEPFFEHRVDEIQRKLDNRGTNSLARRSGNILSRGFGQVLDAAGRVWARYKPFVDEAVTDLRSLLVDEAPDVQNADIRDRLRPYERPGQLTIPTIYRRLFTPVPLDIPDFYVTRHAAEAAVDGAIADWYSLRTGAVLIHADRGMGKRSLSQHVLQTSIAHNTDYTDIATHSIRLSEDLSEVEDLCREVCATFAPSPPTTPEGAIRMIQALDQRHIVVIENAEKIFHRAESGLTLCRAFLDLMTETSEQALWILLMNTPAVGWLETAIGIEDYFTHTIELEALDTDELERVITQRHRVSGFEARFVRPRPRISEWVQRPFRTSESLRDPRAEYFRDLGALSRGNPLLALLYWLQSAEVEESDDSLIHIGTLPDEDIDLIEPLTLVKKLILATLVQHGTLTPVQMSKILRRDLVVVRTELEHLERLGFVETTTGATTSCFQMRPLAEALVTPDLRNRNMI